MTRLGSIFEPTELSHVLPRPRLLQQLLHRKITRSLIDEQIWTLVFTSGFSNAPDALYRFLTEGESAPATCRAWMEMLPLSPRRGTGRGESEGNTNVDLVVGSVCKRGKSESGIQFDPDLGDGVCLVEAKWLSDISHHTTHDIRRNQLARLIEGAATLQHHEPRPGETAYTPCGVGRYPNKVHVTLLTPSVFRSELFRDRLYAYKFHEYKNDPSTIDRDVNGAMIARRETPTNWQYPAAPSRTTLVQLHWVTYEDLFCAIPPGPRKDKILAFARDFGKKGILDLNALHA